MDKQIIYCKPANTEKVHQLDASEVLENNEISCPPFDGCLWSSHPRVFLKLKDQGEVRCPYCGTLYTLYSN
jgi:uncharacterized Zn-finger protein